MYIPEEVIKKIQYICGRISNVEWSGRVFYKLLSGELKTPDSIEIELVDIYLEDKGSSSYTEYEASEDIMDLFDANPELEDCKSGMIHSHQNMGVFFSGTDMDELKENHDKYEMYLSVIVNNMTDICAKIAFPVKRKVKTKSTSTIESFFKFKNQIIKSLRNEDTEDEKETSSMFVIDVDPQIPVVTGIQDKFFLDRVNQVIEEAKKPTYNNTSRWGGNGLDDDKYYGYNGDPRNNWDDYHNYPVQGGYSAIKDNDTVIDDQEDDIREFKDIEVNNFIYKLIKSPSPSSKDLPIRTRTEILESLGKAGSEKYILKYVQECMDNFDTLAHNTFGQLVWSDKYYLLDEINSYFEATKDQKVAVPVCQMFIDEIDKLIEKLNKEYSV